jgi:D-alanine transaminase/branched-chain amino acid aminotransferase
MFAWAYINDNFIPEEKAMLPVRDLSILRGYGVFDFFRFRNFQPVFLSDHLDRLFFSMSGLRLSIEPDKSRLEELIHELIQRNSIPDGGIRITVTGGSSDNGYLPENPSLVITQHSFDEVSAAQFNNGIHLASYAYQRQLPQIKSSDYIMGIYLQPWMKSNDADDVLYMDRGIISECPRSNIFIYNSSGQLCTPSNGILHGITRKKVMHIAKLHYPVIEKDIPLDEVYEAREVFITSTTRQILPVRTIDGRPIGAGQFPICSHILRLYRSFSSIPSGG